jgi:hypothetical protein
MKVSFCIALGGLGLLTAMVAVIGAIYIVRDVDWWAEWVHGGPA